MKGSSGFMYIEKNDRHSVGFVIISMLWTWGVLAVPVMLGYDFENTVTKTAYILAGASPSVTGVIFVLLSGDSEYIRYFLKRVVRLGNSRVSDLLMVFMLVPAVTVISAYINFLFTSALPDWSELVAYFKNPAGLIIFAAFTLAFGPLAEEIGWRGYLLDCWKDKGSMVYGMGIGLIWTLWHLPMFFIAGTYQNSLLVQGAVPVICFVLSTVALGVIIGELTIKTNSILSAILFHFVVNFIGELVTLSPSAELIKTMLFTVIASGIVIVDFMRRRAQNGNGREIKIKA